MDIDYSGVFGNDLYVIGKKSLNDNFGIWRVRPDGTSNLFANINMSYNDDGGLVFGPDHAMYVAEYSSATQYVTISRIVPEPASIMLLGFGALGLIRNRRK